MAAAQTYWLRRMLGGRLEGLETVWALVAMLIAAAGFAAAAFGSWLLLDEVFGRSLVGQLISVGGGLAIGAVLYIRLVLFLDIPEAGQLRRVIDGRLGGRAA
jgi:putative peptidoglycan lipid II flippase